MKTLILGDIHGSWASADIVYDMIVAQHGEPELLLQVGDFGFWPRDPRVAIWDREFNHPCLWIDGNHEDHWVLQRLDEPHWGFDPYHSPPFRSQWDALLQRWTYLPRGTIIDGVLFIGGAKSINKPYLTHGVNWFPEEDLSQAQMHAILDAIEAYGPENIHTVITHEAAVGFDVREACKLTGGKLYIDSNMRFLREVLHRVCPDRWFFGHYHMAMSGTDVDTGCEWRCIDMIRGPGSGVDYVLIDLPFTQEGLSAVLGGTDEEE